MRNLSFGNFSIIFPFLITLRGRVQLEIRKIGYVYSGMKREIRIFYFYNGIDLTAINSVVFQLNKVKKSSDD